MKILHVIPTFAPAWRFGGPIHALYELTREQVRQGHAVTVFTTNLDVDGVLDVALDGPVSLEGVEVRYFAASRAGGNFSATMCKALARRVRAFDLVHIHSVFNWPVTMAAWWSMRRGVPFIIRPAGSLDPVTLAKAYNGRIDSLKSRAKKWLYFQTAARIELARASAIHYLTEAERQAAAPLGFAVPELVIPHGINVPSNADASMLRRKYPQLRGRKIVLFLSRLDRIKGLELLFAAAARLARTRDDFFLVIAGAGPDEYRHELETLRQSLGIASRTIFLGPVGPAEKWDVFSGSDLFVLPSHHENFGLAAVEAMAAGLPLVISDRVNLSGEVLEAGAGLVTGLSVEQIAAAIERLCDDPTLRREMGERGRELVRERFSWPRVTAQLSRAYAQVISRAQASPASPIGTNGRARAGAHRDHDLAACEAVRAGEPEP